MTAFVFTSVAPFPHEKKPACKQYITYIQFTSTEKGQSRTDKIVTETPKGVWYKMQLL